MKRLKIISVVAAAFLICFSFQLAAQAQDKKAVAEQAAAEGKNLYGKGTKEALQNALKKYEEALAIWRELGEKNNEASMLIAISEIHFNFGDASRALEFINQAITSARAVGNKEIEADALLGAGQNYGVLGDSRRSMDSYKQALELARETKSQNTEAHALVSLGYISNQLGENQNALNYYNQAIPIIRATNNKAGELAVLINTGAVYAALGERQRAIDNYQQALPITRELGSLREEAVTLNNLGANYYFLGEKQKAIDYFNQALILRKKTGDRIGESTVLGSIARIYNELGDRQKALDLFNQALTIQRELKIRPNESTTLLNLGRLYFSLADYQKAYEYFAQALPITREVGEIFSELVVLYEMACAQRELGKLNEARSLIENTIQIVESVRATLASQNLRASYFAEIQLYYKFYIDVLMRLHAKQPEKGFDVLALQQSERARARGLLDLLTESRTDIRQGVDVALLERERDLQKQLNAKDAERKRAKNAQQAEALDKEIQTLTATYHDLQAEIKLKSPRYAALTQPQPVGLKEIQALLDADTLLVEYSLGNEASYLWVVSPNSIKSFTLPKRQDIEDKARVFYESIKKPEAEQAARKAASDLSKILIEPAAAELGNKRLLIVADGALQYIPFAALPVADSPSSVAKTNSTDNRQPLIENHEIAYMPSASTLAVLRSETKNRQSAPKTIAVLADPVFDASDTRVNRPPKKDTSTPVSNPTLEKATREAGFQSVLPRLPFTRREATMILSFVSESEGKRAVDFEANRAAVTSPDLAQFRIVHFATHGLLNSQHPELSGIVLSLVDESGKPQDGFLRLNEIYNLKLPADLIVLSACQTALGKEIRGEGLIGLTRGFMYSGAQRVVASLWAVDDQATSELMKSFYQNMLGEKKLRPAAALRQAQLAMWKSKRFNAPYFWSAFTLQGDWR